jgi:hypothetical protein
MTASMRTAPRWLVPALGIVAFQAMVLWWMGRVPICECGTIKLWHGVVSSSENSQHIADWYSFSHIIHGFLFYALLQFLLPRSSLGLRLALALGIEVGWEILENTNMIINRYRAATISLDYYGDSILNSVSDTLMMGLGFLLAARLPVWTIVTLALVFEAGTAYVIRDNLALNIIMLLWPLDAIREWQAAP